MFQAKYEIDGTAALFIRDSDQSWDQWGWSASGRVTSIQCSLDIKRWDNARPGLNLSWNEFDGNVKQTEHCCVDIVKV